SRFVRWTRIAPKRGTSAEVMGSAPPRARPLKIASPDCHAFRWVTASPSVGSRTRARRDAQQDARATNAPTVARRTVPVAPVPKSSGSAKSRPTNAWATVRYAPRPNERRRRGVAEPDLDCHAFRWVTASPSVGSRTRARRDAQQDARATNAPTVARRTVPVAPVPKSSGSAKSRPTNAWATVRYAPRPNERRRRGVAE